MNIVEAVIDFLKQLALQVPVELFALVGSFLEEVFAPIPSPLVMTLSGTMVASDGLPFLYLFVIAVIAAVGKTAGSMVLYLIADKAENLIMTKLGRYVGVTHKQVEQVGARFHGTPRDYITLILIRATPIIPSSPISLICGLIALPKKLYAISTFVGTIVRDFIYLYIGYTGIAAAEQIINGIDSASSVVTIILGVAGVGVLGYIAYRKYIAPKRQKNITPKPTKAASSDRKDDKKTR